MYKQVFTQVYRLIDSSAWNSHTTTDINWGYQGDKKGIGGGGGQKGAREGKKGAGERKKGAALFYFCLAGTLYQTDTQTDGHTDAGQSYPYVPLCFAGDTTTTLQAKFN